MRTGSLELTSAQLSGYQLGPICEPGSYGWLVVDDDGEGMSPATLAKIFDPFFTTKFTGRGLGLAAVLGILRGHGGAIRVESEVGLGTRVEVVLPRATELVGDETDAVQPADEFNQSGLVLVVDDEDAVRDVVALHLQSMGLRTVAAADGQAAVDIFESRANEIDLVVLDLTMPKMGGDEAFQRLVAIKPDVRVILISGYADVNLAQHFEGRAPCSSLKKPFSRDQLQLELRRLLAPELLGS